MSRVAGAAPIVGAEDPGIRRAPAGAPAGTRGFLPADPLRWSLFLLVVMTISRINGKFPFLIPLRPLLLLSGASLAYALVNPRLLSRLPWVQTWPARLVMALGVAACLSAVFGVSLGSTGLFILQEYSKVLLVAFLIMATIRSSHDVHMYIWAYVIAVGILVGDTLLTGQFETAWDSTFQRLGGFNTTYDANDIGVVLLIGLALALYTFQMSRALGKIVSLAIILGIGMTLAKTGSRGAFVGLVALGLAIVVLVDSVPLAKRMGFIAVTAVMLGLASPQGYWKQMQSILSPQTDYNWTSEYGRKAVFERGLGYMASYPIFGVGASNFGRVEGTMSSIAREWRPGDAGVAWTSPHNSFLQAGVEMGVVGLALWSTLVVGVIWSIGRRGRRLSRLWSRGSFDERVVYHAARYVPLAAFGFAVSGSFVSFAYLDPVYFLAALAVGILVLTGNGTQRLSARHNGGRRGGVRASPNAAAYSSM